MSTATPFPVFVALWNEVQGLSTPALHFRIACWLARARPGGGGGRLLMAFRNAGKSTLVGLYAAWLLASDPSLRILVLAADHQLATRMVRNVRRILERHPLTAGLRPKSAEEWASDRFTVTRAREHRDPSMLAKGIGANITGTRADVVICDDVEVPNTCDTPAKRDDLRARLDEIEFVLVPGGLKLFVGTPHTARSIYAERACAEAGETRPYLSGFERLVLPILDRHGKSRWPERFSVARIDAVRDRAGPAKFNAQMMLQPVDQTDARLDPDRLRVYDDELRYREANGRPVLSLGGRRLVSASAFWDPSFGRPGRGDGCVVACVFTDADGDYWLHGVEYLTHVPAAAADIDEATQLCRQAVSFLRRHYLPALTVETNGLGRFLPGLLRREIARAGVASAVVEHASTRNKDSRILDAFDAVLAAGRLHVSAHVRRTPFLAEMREWRPGSGAADDGLDAVAGCLLSEPVRLAAAERSRDARACAMTAWRSGFDPVRLSADFEV